MGTSLAAVTAASTAVCNWGGGGPGWGFGWFFLLIPLFWIAVFVILFSTIGRRWRRAAYYKGYQPGFGPGQGGFGPNAGAAAEQTLAERFAQGDIDEVEYRARLEVLRANRPNQS
jgi:putative membrane protein